jgi:hypothetical protein
VSKMYFVWHWDYGFETFSTEKEAREEAERLFGEDEAMGCNEGFSDDCFGVSWGEISQTAKLCKNGEKVYFDGGLVDVVEMVWDSKESLKENSGE